MNASKVRNKARNERKSRERMLRKLAVPVSGSIQILPSTKWQREMMRGLGATKVFQVFESDGFFVEFRSQNDRPVAIMNPNDWNAPPPPPDGRYIWK